MLLKGIRVEPEAPGVTEFTEAQAESARVEKKRSDEMSNHEISLDWILPFSH